jgi:protease-4
MSESRPGPIKRLFQFLWDALNFTRRLVLNIAFFALLILVVAAIATKKAPTLDERTALVIAPEGVLVEQYTGSPLDRALAEAQGGGGQVRLRDVLRALEAAKDDPKIERVFLRMDGLAGAGFAQLREVAAAIREVRAAGKQVVAYGENMEQRQYYLAAQADEVYLHPAGSLMLEGLGRYRQYYRQGLQEMLGVDVHLFRVGEFKSAAEPYILDGMSDESRAADLHWMGDVWARFLAETAEARGLDAAELQASIDDMPARIRAVGGNVAELAKQQGLVDELKTLDEVRALMIERGVEDTENHTFRQIDLAAYLAHLDLGRSPIPTGPQVAVVVAQGEIAFGDQGTNAVGGVSTSALIRQAREDENVKAVVLRVDSPGGGVFPSEQIRREVELTRAAGKPVVVSMGNVAASGGYWISMNADEIYADPSTITGSIGIFGLWFTADEALAKIGVRTDGVGTTRFAGAFDPTRPFDPAVGEFIQTVIDHGYQEFIGKVAEARGKSLEEADAAGRGRVWSGAQALELGLVDTLGGLRDAQAKAAELASLADGAYTVTYVERPLQGFEAFMAGFTGEARAAALLRHSGVANLLDPRTAGSIQRDLAFLQSRLGAQPYQAVAHCFCGL